MKTLIINYINGYENHFKNENRNSATFEKMQYAGLLLDTKFPEFTEGATYYKALYEKCKKFFKK